MPDPIDFNSKRFAAKEDPAEHSPLAALDAAREWYQNSEHKPDHIIVLLGRTTENNGSGTKYMQAGKYPHHAQMGLLLEGIDMIRGSGNI